MIGVESLFVQPQTKFCDIDRQYYRERNSQLRRKYYKVLAGLEDVSCPKYKLYWFYPPFCTLFRLSLINFTSLSPLSAWSSLAYTMCIKEANNISFPASWRWTNAPTSSHIWSYTYSVWSYIVAVSDRIYCMRDNLFINLHSTSHAKCRPEREDSHEAEHRRS